MKTTLAGVFRGFPMDFLSLIDPGASRDIAVMPHYDPRRNGKFLILQTHFRRVGLIMPRHEVSTELSSDFCKDSEIHAWRSLQFRV
jgi:hypothetical protein